MSKPPSSFDPNAADAEGVRLWLQAGLEGYFKRDMGRWAFRPLEHYVGLRDDLAEDLGAIYQDVEPHAQGRWRTAIRDLLAMQGRDLSKREATRVLMDFAALIRAYEVLDVLPALLSSDADSLLDQVVETAVALANQTDSARICLQRIHTSPSFSEDYAGLVLAALCHVDPDGWLCHVENLARAMNILASRLEDGSTALRSFASGILEAISLSRLDGPSLNQLACSSESAWLWKEWLAKPDSLLCYQADHGSAPLLSLRANDARSVALGEPLVGLNASTLNEEDALRTFHTPPGKAGSDQLYGMEEAIQGDIRAMFQAGAERDILDYGVGQTVDTGSYRDASIRMEVRRRECDARLTSSAGRAVERALKLIHACGTDRIMGREFPSVDEQQMKKDTQRGHGLTVLWKTILEDMGDRDMKIGLEDAYQKALNRGLLVVTLDDKEMWTVFASIEDIPLREHFTGGVSDGEEYTIDHLSAGSLMFGPFHKGEKSEFSKLPISTFKQFLEKADRAYYERDSGHGRRRNLSWESYSARDHERSRPYAVAGMRFFARLAKELVGLSKQYWVSDKARLIRSFERGNYNIRKLMKAHANQRFRDKVTLPPMIPANELVNKRLEFGDDIKVSVERGYDNLRQKQPWVTKAPSDNRHDDQEE